MFNFFWSAGTHVTISKIECLDDSCATGLRDWAAIRAHLKRHDDEMVGDYADDINTMLVFVSILSFLIFRAV